MKKVLLIVLSLLSFNALADRVLIERGFTEDTKNGANSTAWLMKGAIDFTKNYAIDAEFQESQVTATNKVSSRVDVGFATKTDKIWGPVSLFGRVATGEKYTTPTNYPYWQVEPGVRVDIVEDKFFTRIGWRFRTPYDQARFQDETRTWRYGLYFNVTSNDTIGARLDQVRGNVNQNTLGLNYQRSF
jgi:hypothetical protein